MQKIRFEGGLSCQPAAQSFLHAQAPELEWIVIKAQPKAHMSTSIQILIGTTEQALCMRYDNC